ncbi:TPA: cupredoxin family copper-binding protein [Candidatus Woesearchaeota archaeon]|nr:cupredoxin family copper-binding protein [Candidatus Woesearchaeota archaeon]HII88152.1 cupredoxin family copper-binding protein [Candidatus Woesearchaeota archaeon]
MEKAEYVIDLVVVLVVLLSIFTFAGSFSPLPSFSSLTGMPVYNYNNNPNSIQRGWTDAQPDQEPPEMQGVKRQSLNLKRYPVGYMYGIKRSIFVKYTPLMEHCTDTDVENDPFQKGHVRVYYAPENQRKAELYTDYCVNDKILIQHDCDPIRGRVLPVKNYPCPSGCDEGVCKYIIPFVGPAEAYAVGQDNVPLPEFWSHEIATLSRNIPRRQIYEENREKHFSERSNENEGAFNDEANQGAEAPESPGEPDVAEEDLADEQEKQAPPQPPQPSAPETHNIEIGATLFSPATLEIEAGDTVIWKNTATVAHTVTANDGSFDSGLLQKDKTFSRTFSSPGRFAYHCELHPMAGTIVVK